MADLGPIWRAVPDGHCLNGPYVVESLYFDNPAQSAFLDHLDGSYLREKVRLRWYPEHYSGKPSVSRAFMVLECKRKSGAAMVKMQHVFNNFDFEDALRIGHRIGTHFPHLAGQELTPRVTVRYRRYAVTIKGAHAVFRVTLDTLIQTLPPDHFGSGSMGTYTVTPEQGVLEIKTPDLSDPVVQEVIARIASRRVSNSKFILGSLHQETDENAFAS